MSVGLVTPGIPGASGKPAASAAKYDDGTLTGESQAVRSFVANAAIVAGEAVILVGPTYTSSRVYTGPRVARIPVVGTLSGRSVIGVALNDAVAGEVVKVATDHGWVRCQATAGQGILQSATAGVAVGAAIAVAAANTQWGVALVATTANVFPSVTSPATNAETNGVFVRFSGCT